MEFYFGNLVIIESWVAGIFHLGGLHLPLGCFASSAWVACSLRLGCLHLPVGWFASSALDDLHLPLSGG